MKTTIQLELTKKEINLLMRAASLLLMEENSKSTRRMGGEWVPTKNYNAAEALEAKLIAARKAVQA
jgi:hypothetical protein